MAKKIDPLNKKQYGAVSAMLTVSEGKSCPSPNQNESDCPSNQEF